MKKKLAYSVLGLLITASGTLGTYSTRTDNDDTVAATEIKETKESKLKNKNTSRIFQLIVNQQK